MIKAQALPLAEQKPYNVDMADSNPKSKQQIVATEIGVHIPNELRSGRYANIVNATVTPGEVTLNFIYANPNDTPQGTLVSRVVVNRDTAREMAELLRQIIATADEVNPK